MKRIVAIGTAAGLAAMAAPASAEPDGGNRAWPLHRLDLNRDGSVSTAEAGARRQVRFLSWDADGDGVVTEAELLARMRARMEARVAKRFARLDRNGDGRVERDEFEADGADRFARMDTDGDGRIGVEELQAGRDRYRHRGRHGALPGD